MIYATYVGLFSPLLSFLILLFSSFFINRKITAILACGSVLLSFICFSTLLYGYTTDWSTAEQLEVFQWIPVKGIDANFTLYIDPISLMMALIITGVGFLIHVYSVGYMEHDADFTRYFTCLNFFIFSMLILVLADHLLVVFVGWEGVGLASYLLIGFWYERSVATSAAIKAFVVNRIGDLGFLLALLLTFHLFGTGNIIEVVNQAEQTYPTGAPIITLLTLLYFVGAMGKSAQIPLHTWLPDAMAGPTPVSALIHAATMVTAGVYLIVRMHGLFLLSPFTMHFIGIIGGVTALYASLSAIGQTDIKKILAYSTISQLGLMFLACGAGSFYAAMFHLTTHAFVKALLFLSAGNILHMAHDITDLSNMGNLKKKMPITNWLFLIGVLSLSGVPPLAAFFSKDFILEEEHLLGLTTLYYLGLSASVLTGVYLIRLYYLAFQGTTRMESKQFTLVKEAPNSMLAPLYVLAFLSVSGGFLGYAFQGTSLLENFLSGAGLRDIIQNSGNIFTFNTNIAIFGALIGMVITWIACSYCHVFEDRPYKILKSAFYIDPIYHFTFVKPLKKLSLFINDSIEPQIIEKTISTAATMTDNSAKILQRLQSGQIRSYVAWMIIGTALTLILFVF